MHIKVIFRKETKKLTKKMDFEGLCAYVKKAFKDLPAGDDFKFFYMDSEGDMISVSTQDDFEEALECMEGEGALKLVVEETIEKAREMFESLANHTMSESTLKVSQMPLQQKGNTAQPISESQIVGSSSNQIAQNERSFEEVKSEYDLNDRVDGDMLGQSPPEDHTLENQADQKLPKFKNNIELTQEIYENDQFDRLNEPIERKETSIKKMGSAHSFESQDEIRRIEDDKESSAIKYEDALQKEHEAEIDRQRLLEKQRLEREFEEHIRQKEIEEKMAQ